MNISAINSINNINYVPSFRGVKPDTEAANAIKKTVADIVDNGAEKPAGKQPFKIPERVQKFAKKVYNFTIKVLDTF